jgi:integration host factor subunit beta
VHELDSIETKTVDIIVAETVGRGTKQLSADDVRSEMFQTTIVPADRALLVGFIDAIEQPILPKSDVLYLTESYLASLPSGPQPPPSSPPTAWAKGAVALRAPDWDLHFSLTSEILSGNDPDMTKSELIAGLAADNPHLRAEDAEAIVNAILDGIANALARGGKVELRGFGTFTVRRRRARTGRNPRNGRAVPVEEKAVPFFKAGKGLRERVDRGVVAKAKRDRNLQPA